MEDQETKGKARRAIERYRKLRQWVTDVGARRALRELIGRAEASLTDEPEGTEESRDK